MQEKSLIQHSDKNFSSGFRRYFFIDKILKADSWENAISSTNKLSEDDIEKMLFEEFQLFNIMIKMDFVLIDYILKMYEENNLDIDLENFKQKCITRMKMTNSEAEKLLNDKIEGNNNRLLTPVVLSYFCDYTLGGLFYLLKKNIKEIDETQTNLLDMLEEFKDIRNDFIHNRCSSYIDNSSIVNKGIKKGLEIFKILDPREEDPGFGCVMEYGGDEK